jgi:hypothetical protein
MFWSGIKCDRKANHVADKGKGISNSSNWHLIKCKIYLQEKEDRNENVLWGWKVGCDI